MSPRRRAFFETLEKRELLAADFTNPLKPTDVNTDNYVTPIDALMVVNMLNAHGSLEVSSLREMDMQYFPDTNGDLTLSPIDALIVVNELNGEGESQTLDAPEPTHVEAIVRNGNLFLHGSSGSDSIQIFGMEDGTFRLAGSEGTLINGTPEIMVDGPIHYWRLFLNSGNDEVQIHDIGEAREFLLHSASGNLTANATGGETEHSFRIHSFNGKATLSLNELRTGGDFQIETHGDSASIVASNIDSMQGLRIGTFGGDDKVVVEQASARSLIVHTHGGRDRVSAADVVVEDDVVIHTGSGDDGDKTQPGVEIVGLTARDAVVVNTGAGNDSLYLSEIFDARHLSVLTGSGDDLVAGELLTIRDDLFSEFGGGDDTVGFVDIQTGHSAQFHGHAGRDRLWLQGVDTEGDVNLFSGDHADLIAVEQVSSHSLHVDGGARDDDLALRDVHTARSQRVIGGGGKDIVSHEIDGVTTSFPGSIIGAVASTIEFLDERINEVLDVLADLGLGSLNVDTDGDSLSDRDEKRIHNTDPKKFDTDGDLLGDGFEARSSNLDPLSPDDSSADPDQDNLSNIREQIFDTDPDNPDTDGDGTNDGGETNQGSDPKDPGDKGMAPDPDDVVEVRLTVGDPSGSHSERYDLRVGPILHQATQFGVVETAVYKIRKGSSYPIQIIHRGSRLSEPDYDYLARVESVAGAETQFVLLDEQGILGRHDESSFFFASGKEATLLFATLEIETDKESYQISSDTTMPTINATAKIVGYDRTIPDMPEITWSTMIQYDASTAPNGPQRQINHSISETVSGFAYTPSFSAVRGGRLSFIATVTIDGITFTGEKSDVIIAGSNPTEAQLRQEINNETLQRIARQESGFRQFSGDHPLWSGDGFGGVGLFQITNPQPTDDEVWNWKSNVARGREIFQEKLRIARRYPAQLNASNDFPASVAALNESRQQNGLPPLDISAPEYTEEQATLDAIRGFNGWAGRDRFNFPLHEFRLAYDENGFPRFRITDEATGQAEAIWERVPASDRPQNTGDPDYVNHVLSRNP